MTFYKIICNGEFAGIASSYDLRKYQRKHNIIVTSDETGAQYVQTADDTFYRDEWMAPVTEEQHEYISAQIISIDEDEYNTLLQAIESNQEITIEPEQPQQPKEPQVDEVQEITVDFMKQQKIAELSKTCNQIIEQGFDVQLSDGKTHHFSLTIADQMNISTLSAQIDAGMEMIPYHADGELCKFFSVADVQTIINGAITHKTLNVTLFNSLKAYVNSLRSINTVSAVEYTTPIPERYQSEVLKALLAGGE